MVIDASTKHLYDKARSRIHAIIDRIFSLCDELEYSDVMHDNLRVLNGIFRSTLDRISKNLHWDNAPSAIRDSWMGRPCLFISFRRSIRSG